MSLRIQGAPLVPSPSVRRAEISRRDADPGGAPAATSTPAATSAAPALTATEPSSPPVDEAASTDGNSTSTTGLAVDEARQAAERLREQMLAQPAPVARVHGNLIAATVLNLLA